ncbi:gp53-like domain-containing protein [Serratia sp. IR-2025]
MPKNEFLPFGTAANANVLPNADYQALPARSSGFNSGVAKSEQLNTVWRQASVIASVVAQFIVDNTGKDVLDDGDLAGLQVNLGDAIKGAVGTFEAQVQPKGYQKLPSGTIIQWGAVQIAANSTQENEFPIPFIDQCFSFQITLTYPGPNVGVNGGATSKSRFGIQNYSDIAAYFQWMAIGR